ncbi:hypothetical protein [Hydrogenophaga atypica]|uniref:C2H2-type domain-containing protein n=1 Tax=Hydrogenophaga atypica TaxID=249409 RepID=A0ABW2QJI9_9BURK
MNKLPLVSSDSVRPTGNYGLTSKAMFQCQSCNLVLPNQTLLISHVIGAHGKKAMTKMLRKASQPAFSKKEKNQFDTTEIQKVFHVANDKDATKGWGHAYRDNGQFGSYPLYDAMDDESEP